MRFGLADGGTKMRMTLCNKCAAHLKESLKMQKDGEKHKDICARCGAAKFCRAYDIEVEDKAQ